MATRKADWKPAVKLKGNLECSYSLYFCLRIDTDTISMKTVGIFDTRKKAEDAIVELLKIDFLNCCRTFTKY